MKFRGGIFPLKMLASGAHWARVGSAEAAPLWNPVEPEREASDGKKSAHHGKVQTCGFMISWDI